jgi:hypothetical protein
MYVEPYMALINESSSRRSASTISNWLKRSPKAFFNGSTFFSFLTDLTVPLTLNPPFLRKYRQT